MYRVIAVFLAVLALASSNVPAAGKELNADQIVERYLKARGGADTWQGVNSLQMSGVLLTGKKETGDLPITVYLLRPHLSRVDFVVKDVHASQVFDGKTGFKVRQVQGQTIVLPFSGEDQISVRAWRDIDSPLFDHEMKGLRVTLDGKEKIDGKETYRLLVTRLDQGSQHFWIDAKSFLEVKSDDTLKRPDGSSVTLETYYRDFRKVDGVTIPAEREIRGGKPGDTRTLVFKELKVNPALEMALFEKPAASDPSKTPIAPRMVNKPAAPANSP